MNNTEVEESYFSMFYRCVGYANPSAKLFLLLHICIYTFIDFRIRLPLFKLNTHTHTHTDVP